MKPRGIYKYQLLDLVYCTYLIIISALIVFAFPRIPYALPLLLVHLVWIAAILLLARFLGGRNPFVESMGRIIFVLITLPLAFSELGALVHYVNPNDHELLLIKIDYFLFGVNPTQYLQSITTPILTEYLQIIYSTFYFLPVFLGVFLIAKKRVREMNITLLAVVSGFFLSYFGYFLVPALPPYRIHELYGQLPHTVALDGLWFTETLREVLNTLEKIKRDCFPSGHTEVSVIVLWLAYKFDRKAFAVLLPVVVSLVFSTVYLRYHYVIDVIAGILLALPVLYFSPKVYDWWEGQRKGS